MATAKFSPTKPHCNVGTKLIRPIAMDEGLTGATSARGVFPALQGKNRENKWAPPPEIRVAAAAAMKTPAGFPQRAPVE